MPASLDRIRREANIQPTAQDKGLVAEIRVVAYDNGIVEVNGHPMSAPGAAGWLDAAEMAVAHLKELRRQAAQRQA